MSTHLVCPHCGKSFHVDALPIGPCPHCGGELPQNLVEELESTFIPSRPLSLTVQVWCGYAAGTYMALTIPSAFTPADDTIFKMLEIPPLPHAPPVVAGMLYIVQCILLLWSSYSLHINQYRSRNLLLMMVFMFLIPQAIIYVPAISSGDFGRAIFSTYATAGLLCLISTYMYLYHWKYTTRYYDSIAYRQSAAHMQSKQS